MAVYQRLPMDADTCNRCRYDSSSTIDLPFCLPWKQQSGRLWYMVAFCSIKLPFNTGKPTDSLSRIEEPTLAIIHDHGSGIGLIA